jgi:hypothetical protein
VVCIGRDYSLLLYCWEWVFVSMSVVLCHQLLWLHLCHFLPSGELMVDRWLHGVELFCVMCSGHAG